MTCPGTVRHRLLPALSVQARALPARGADTFCDPSNVDVGRAVTSHDDTRRATATFDGSIPKCSRSEWTRVISNR